MRPYLIAYPATLVVFLAVDAVWLSTMTDILYRPVLGDMIAADVRLTPAVLFYLIYVAGLTFFAVRAGLRAGSTRVALFNGAALGFVAYATYDLTNQATLKNWSTTLTVADLLWGSFVSAIASGAGQWIAQRFASRKP